MKKTEFPQKTNVTKLTEEKFWTVSCRKLRKF